MDEDDVAPGELFSPAHSLLHHLAVVDDELEIEIAHRDAGPALAGRGLVNVAHPPTELEVGGLDRVLQQRAVDLLGHRVDERGVTLELGEAKWRAQPLHHRVHEIGDDVLRMLELDRREKTRIAGDVGNREIRRFSLRKHQDLQRNRFHPIAQRAVCHTATPAVEAQRNRPLLPSAKGASLPFAAAFVGAPVCGVPAPRQAFLVH